MGNLIVKVNVMGQLTSAVKMMRNTMAVVGITNKTAPRKYEYDTNNADVGYKQERGGLVMHHDYDTGEKKIIRIPPRPFLIPGVELAKSDILFQLEGCVKNIDKIENKDVRLALSRAGRVGKESVKRIFFNNSWDPLSAITIAKRQSRKYKPQNKGTRPLLDLGELHNSITSEVRKSTDVD